MIFSVLFIWHSNRQLERIASINRSLTKQIKFIEQKINTHQELLGDLTASTTILNEAVHADSKRKVKINKTRLAIKDIIKRINIPEIKKLTPVDITEIATAIIDNGEKFSVPASLLLAIIRQESAFNKKAISIAGAQGLIQMLPTTAEDCKQDLNQTFYDPFKPAQNIKFGAFYLGKMLNKFEHNVIHAVMAYNTGPENVIRFLSGSRLLHPETIDYEKRVIAFWKEYQKYGID